MRVRPGDLAEVRRIAFMSARVVSVSHLYVYVRWIEPHQPDGDRLSAYRRSVFTDLFRVVR